MRCGSRSLGARGHRAAPAVSGSGARGAQAPQPERRAPTHAQRLGRPEVGLGVDVAHQAGPGPVTATAPLSRWASAEPGPNRGRSAVPTAVSSAATAVTRPPTSRARCSSAGLSPRSGTSPTGVAPSSRPTAAAGSSVTTTTAPTEAQAAAAATVSASSARTSSSWTAPGDPPSPVAAGSWRRPAVSPGRRPTSCAPAHVSTPRPGPSAGRSAAGWGHRSTRCVPTGRPGSIMGRITPQRPGSRRPGDGRPADARTGGGEGGPWRRRLPQQPLQCTVDRRSGARADPCPR